MTHQPENPEALTAEQTLVPEPVAAVEPAPVAESVPAPVLASVELPTDTPALANASEPVPVMESAVEPDPEPSPAPVSPVAEPIVEPVPEIAEVPEPPVVTAPVVAEELAAVEPAPAELVSNTEPVPEQVVDPIEPPVEAPELASAADPAPEEEAVDEPVTAVEPVPEPTTLPVGVAEPEPAAVEPTAAESVSSAEPSSSEEVPEQVVDPIEPATDEPELGSNPEPAPVVETAGEPEAVDESEPSPAPVAVAEPAAAAAPEPQPDPKLPIKTRDDAADLSPFSVIVSQVYDGPLDLLLDLIRKQDIDIYDIPIARITAQFLAYVNQLKATDVDVAGEFIYIASLLIHIKSKMLLPRAAAGPDDAAEDPRRELVERLLEHERFKNAAQMLQQKQMLEAASWTNPGIREFKGDAAAEPEIAADTVDLVRIFRDILERARRRPVFNVDEDAVTVGQMMQFLARRLTMEDKPIALRRLLSHTRSERALVAMFLALLELVRLQAVLLRQDKAFSEIFIKKHTAFDAVMNEGLANAPSDEWR